MATRPYWPSAEQLRKHIEENSTPEPNSGCWLWDLSKRGEYGRSVIGQRQYRSHRIAAVAFLGLNVSDKTIAVCHSCDTPMCVNPNHLFLGTHAANFADMMAKDRQRKGEDVWRSVLNNDDIQKILQGIEAGKTIKEVACAVGCNDAVIYAVLKNKHWSWLKRKYPELHKAALKSFALNKHSALRKPVLCVSTGVRYESGKAAAEANQVSRPEICRACKTGKSLNGLYYQYAAHEGEQK